MIVSIIFVVLFFFALLGGFYTVDTQSVRIVERFSKFVRIGQAGLNFKIPLIERASDDFSLRVQEFKIETETKTKDNVFVLIAITVQYAVSNELNDVYNAYYKLSNVKQQLASWVNDAIRSAVPILALDDVYSQKDAISTAIRTGIATKLTEYGYTIHGLLITDLRPDEKVQEAMNEINASKRLQEAAQNKAEAEKIMVVKNAEAQSESKRLAGEGIAMERLAITEGLKKSVELMEKATGIDAKEVMQTIMLTQYFDTLREVGTSQNAKVLMIPSDPQGVNSLRNTLIATNQV